jgi:hypothetical protein
VVETAAAFRLAESIVKQVVTNLSAQFTERQTKKHLTRRQFVLVTPRNQLVKKLLDFSFPHPSINCTHGSELPGETEVT